MQLSALRAELLEAKREQQILFEQACDIAFSQEIENGERLNYQPEYTTPTLYSASPSQGAKKLSWSSQSHGQSKASRVQSARPSSLSGPKESPSMSNGDFIETKIQSEVALSQDTRASNAKGATVTCKPLQNAAPTRHPPMLMRNSQAATQDVEEGGAAAVNSARKQAHRDFLYLFLNDLGGSSTSLHNMDHLMLTAETVLAVVKEEVHRQVSEAAKGGEQKGARIESEKALKTTIEAIDRITKQGETARVEMEGRLAALEAERTKLLRNLEAALKERKNLEGKSAQQSRELKVNIDSLRSCQEELALSKSQAEKISKAVKAQETKGAASEKALATLTTEVKEKAETMRRDQERLEARLKEALSTEKVLKSEIEKQQSRLKKAEDEKSRAEMFAAESLSSLNQVIDEFSLSLTWQSSSEDSFSSLAEELKDLKATYQATLSSCQDECLSAKKEISEELLRQQRIIKDLRAEADADVLRRDLKSSKAEVLKYTSALSQAQATLSASESSKQAILSRTSQLEAEIKSLTQSQTELSSLLESSDQRLKQEAMTRQEFEAESERLLRKAKAAEARIETLERALELTRMESTRIRSRAERAEEEVRSLSLKSKLESEAVSQASKRESEAAAEVAVSQASSLIRSFRLKYFPDVIHPSAPPSSSRPISAAPGKPPLSPQHIPPSSAQAADESLLANGGPGICNMGHDELVRSLEVFLEQQSSAFAKHGRHSQSGGSSLVQRELLWLEGSLLFILVDLRGKTRELQEVQEQLQSTRSTKANSLAGSQQLNSLPLRSSLASQMLKSLATEKAALQSKLSKLENQPSASQSSSPLIGSAPHYLSYYQVRRDISRSGSQAFGGSSQPPPFSTPRLASSRSTPTASRQESRRESSSEIDLESKVKRRSIPN